jgi:hypothetical protein
MDTKLFRNIVLKHLDTDSIARLRLRRIELPLLYDLEKPGSAIEHIYFLEQGIGSMTTCFENGSQVETSMFGYESAIGISALMGTKNSLNRIFMQLAGFGYVAPLEAVEEEFSRNGRFQKLALRIPMSSVWRDGYSSAATEPNRIILRWLRSSFRRCSEAQDRR